MHPLPPVAGEVTGLHSLCVLECEYEYEYDGRIRGLPSSRTRTCPSPQRGLGIQPRAAGAWRPMPWGDPPRIRAMQGHQSRSFAGW